MQAYSSVHFFPVLVAYSLGKGSLPYPVISLRRERKSWWPKSPSPIKYLELLCIFGKARDSLVRKRGKDFKELCVEFY